jgi:uncharacterized protein (TIGR03435 family)
VRRIGLFAVLALASACLLTAAVKVGDRAPNIHFDKLLPDQPAANGRFEALAGKVVVLEMWATWCGACVNAIPHLNELAEKFKGRPIVFLSATDEEPAVVEAFLKKRPIGGLVGIAHTESPWKLYDVDGIPATFLIDAAGKIAGSTDPEMLSASMLEDLMTGRPLPPVELIIRPLSTTNSFNSIAGRNSLVMKGTRLESIISYLWDIRPSRMSGGPLADAAIYDLSLSIPGATPANFRSWARDVVAAAFHVKVNRETRETDVWILAKTEMKPAVLVEPAATGASQLFAGSLQLRNSTVPVLVMLLESAIRKPVFDETGITGSYDLNLSYDKADAQGPIEAMRKLGFKVEPARRLIDFLVVIRAE